MEWLLSHAAMILEPIDNLLFSILRVYLILHLISELYVLSYKN